MIKRSASFGCEIVLQETGEIRLSPDNTSAAGCSIYLSVKIVSSILLRNYISCSSAMCHYVAE